MYGDGHFAVLLTDINELQGTFRIEGWPYGTDDQPQIRSSFPRKQFDFQAFVPGGPYSIFGSQDGSWRGDIEFVEQLNLLDEYLRVKVLQVFNQQTTVFYGTSPKEIYE